MREDETSARATTPDARSTCGIEFKGKEKKAHDLS